MKRKANKKSKTQELQTEPEQPSNLNQSTTDKNDKKASEIVPTKHNLFKTEDNNNNKEFDLNAALNHLNELLSLNQILTDSELGFLGNVKRRLNKMVIKVNKEFVQNVSKQDTSITALLLDENNNPVENNSIVKHMADDEPTMDTVINALDLNNNEIKSIDYDSDVILIEPTIKPQVGPLTIDPYKHINFFACQQRSDSKLFENSMFKICFDIGTPRPHFIILIRKNFKSELERKKERVRVTETLNETELESLLDLCEAFITSINGQSEAFTLAFHTGNWATSKVFHAHLCVNTDLYLRILSAKNLDPKFLVPSKNWHGVSNDKRDMYSLFVQNVRDYEHLEQARSRVYKLEALEAIKVSKESGQNNKPPTYQIPFVNKRFVDIEYDIEEPHLIFTLKEEVRVKWTLEKQRLQLVKTLIDYANKQGFFELDKDKSKGCHICIDLYPQQTAYLRIDAHAFFKMHPEPEIFLSRYSDLTKKCYVWS